MPRAISAFSEQSEGEASHIIDTLSPCFDILCRAQVLLCILSVTLPDSIVLLVFSDSPHPMDDPPCRRRTQAFRESELLGLRSVFASSNVLSACFSYRFVGEG